MKLLSLYRCVVMSSVDEHCKTSSINLSSHSSKESESKMLQPDTSSSNDNETKSRTDDATVKVLNNDPVEDSEQWSDKAANAVCKDTSPNKTIHPVNSSDEIVKSKTVEATTAASHESANTAAASEGNNEIVLTFPQRLMEMLDDPQNSEMMAWLPHGRAFAIYRKREFATDVLPKYFQKAAKYSSFTRKLNRWGFVRVTRGPETGAYYHQLFRRNERRLVLQMTCHTAAATNNSNANPNVSTESSLLSVTAKRISSSSHEAVGNDSMAMMMMYPNYLDPAASQYMYHQNPYAVPRPQQHPSQYPMMGPQPQNYYGNNISPYSMYEETPIDGMMQDEGQYYPPAMGVLYPNHYAMPQSHRQFSDSYAQPPFHDNGSNTYISKNDKTMPPLATRQYYHDDTVRQPRRMSGMSERLDHTSRTTSNVAATDDEELRAQSYTSNEIKTNYRMMQKGMSSSFRPAGRHDSGYHHVPGGYGNRDDGTMLYHSSSASHHLSSQLYDNMGVSGSKAERPVILPTGFVDESEGMQYPPPPNQEHEILTSKKNPHHDNNHAMDHSLYSPAVRQTSPYNNATQQQLPPHYTHTPTTGDIDY